MTQEHAKYDQKMIYGTTYDTYIYYIENLQQTRLCGARSGLPQLVPYLLGGRGEGGGGRGEGEEGGGVGYPQEKE